MHCTKRFSFHSLPFLRPFAGVATRVCCPENFNALRPQIKSAILRYSLRSVSPEGVMTTSHLPPAESIELNSGTHQPIQKTCFERHQFDYTWTTYRHNH